MKKNKKHRTELNRQLILLAMGIICLVLPMPAIIRGNFAELLKVHPGKLRNMPLLVFLIAGLAFIAFSSINMIRMIRDRRKGKN